MFSLYNTREFIADRVRIDYKLAFSGLGIYFGLVYSNERSGGINPSTISSRIDYSIITYFRIINSGNI
jgi:hypothetical protein